MKDENGGGQFKRLEGVKRIADWAGKSERTVKRWCAVRHEKRIPILKIGGRYVAYEADLAAWMAGDA